MMRALLLGALCLLLLGPEKSPAVSTSDRWAVVAANGFLSRGFGVVSSQNSSEGIYVVRFNRNITNCVYVATLGDPGPGTPNGGLITVASSILNNRSVVVVTRKTDQNLDSRNFHLFVSCPPGT